jgi:hypothetical protein
LAATSARAASARRIWSAASTSCASRNASYTTHHHVRPGTADAARKWQGRDEVGLWQDRGR